MPSESSLSKIPRQLILIFIFLTLGILLIGWVYYQHQAGHIKRDKQNDLAAILDLKIQQIVNWRLERLADAKVIRGDSFFAQQAKELLGGQESIGHENKILRRMQTLTFYQYQRIALIDRNGKVILSIPEAHLPLDDHTKRLAAAAISHKDIIFSDLYRDQEDKTIHLSLLVPIMDPNTGNRQAIGAILLGIDPNQFLYPLIQTWPTPSATAATILLHRSGNEVVFLNALRRQPDSALNFRLPRGSSQVSVVLAEGGKRRVIDGRDYRGRRVLAAGDHIPDSPWYLVAKVDQREIFQPIADYVWQTSLMMVALVFCAGLGMAYVWRNQQASFYRRQFETERDKGILAQRYSYLNKYANDIILLADQEMRLLEANDRAVETYGYDKDALLQLSLQDLQPEETRLILEEKLRQVAAGPGALFETSQRHRDGTVFPVEISLNRLEIENQTFYQAFIRDVTGRKEAEEALRRSEASLAEAQRMAHLARWEWDIQTGKVTWSDEGYQIFGLMPEEELGPKTFISFVHPEDLAKVQQQVEQALQSGEYGPYDYRIIRRDGALRVIHSMGKTSFDAAGRPLRMIGTAQDITERMLAEEALRESEENLRQLTGQLLTAQEGERRRISMVLHDELGQTLMVFHFQLQAIRDQLRQEHNVLSHDCEEMLQHLDGVVNQVRQLSRDLNPPNVLAELGFMAALQYLLEEFTKYYSIEKKALQVDDLEPLFTQQSLVIIYRIIQEALTNIGRHAKASRIGIKIKREGDLVSFVVRDDGKGFDKKKVFGKRAIYGGLGLASMQERVRMLGGALSIWSREGSGTRISFSLPVEIE